MDEVPRDGGGEPPFGGEPAPQPRVFINYRHDDTAGEALLLYGTLAARFGPDNVFLDVKSLTAGEEWLKGIHASGGRGGAFLVLIGNHWLEYLQVRSDANIELAEPPHKDIVCDEIEWALRDWPGHVIPVLLGTPMPDPKKLPRRIRAIADKHAFEVHHNSFDPDVARLIDEIERRTSDAPEPTAKPETTTDGRHEQKVEPGTADGPPSYPSGITAPGEDHYEEVAKNLDDGNVVTILGSHVCGTIPDAEELARYIVTEYGLRDFGPKPDLAEVAQFVAVTMSDSRLRRALMKALRERQPTPVHRFLAGLPKRFESRGKKPMYQLIITSNYDDALERAFDEEHEPFDLAVYMAPTGQFVHYPWKSDSDEQQGVPIDIPNKYPGFPIDVDEGELEHTVIVKIHGGTDVAVDQSSEGEGCVLTEDQYIDYLPNENIGSVVPIQVLTKLKLSNILFLGYHMRTWNERIFLRRLWHTFPSEPGWAIEESPDVFEQKGWGQTRVQLFGSPLNAYVERLGEALA
jgi:hypothetical protein